MRDHPLFQAILQDPHDVEARRVYADVLLEGGDPLGGFIAAQCEASRLHTFDPRRPALLARAARLWAEHGRDWLRDLVPYEAVRGEVRFSPSPGFDVFGPRARMWVRGGFPARFEHLPPLAETSIEELAQRTPIDGLWLYFLGDLGHERPPLRAPHGLDRWRFVGLPGLHPETVDRFAHWDLSAVEELDAIDFGGLPGWLDQDTSPRALRHLAVQPLTDAPLGALFRHRSVQALESLAIVGRLQADDIDHLRGTPARAALTSLRVTGGLAADVRDLRLLAGWPSLETLERLQLPRHTPVDVYDAWFPQTSPHLRDLWLSSNRSVPALPERILRWAERYARLHLGDTQLGFGAVVTLLRSPALVEVQQLHLNRCGLTDASVRALVHSPLRSLVALDLSSNRLTDDSCRMLADWEGMQHVAFLRIGNNRRVTLRGYAALAASRWLDVALLDVGKADETCRAPLEERWPGRVRAGR